MLPLGQEIVETAHRTAESLNNDGLRVIAVAYKKLEFATLNEYRVNDESDLILLGFVAF